MRGYFSLDVKIAAISQTHFSIRFESERYAKFANAHVRAEICLLRVSVLVVHKWSEKVESFVFSYSDVAARVCSCDFLIFNIQFGILNMIEISLV